MSLVEIKDLTKRFGDNLIWENGLNTKQIRPAIWLYKPLSALNFTAFISRIKKYFNWRIEK